MTAELKVLSITCHCEERPESDEAISFGLTEKFAPRTRGLLRRAEALLAMTYVFHHLSFIIHH